MNFDDTDEEANFRREVRDWLHANAPQNLDFATLNYAQDFAPFKSWQAKKARDGWARITWAPEFGGRNGSAIEQVIWNQEEAELAYLSFPFIIGLGMAGATLQTHGSKAIQDRYVPPMVSGEEVWCQLFSEPAAGSDLAGIRTRAVRDGDEWIVTGQKIWTSFAHVADYAILVTRTDPTVPKHRGLTYFILDMRSPGIEVRPIKMVSGESDFNEVFLSDVRIPDAHRIGDVGRGWSVALTTLMNERLSVGTSFSTNFDDILDLVAALDGEGGSLGDDTAVREQLADWFLKSNGLKYTGYRMISALSRGESPGPEASISKLVLGRGRQQLAALALDLQGMAGILTDAAETPLESLFQKVFFRSIGNRLEGGTDEILLNIIGERVLGLPADVRVDKDRPFNEVASGPA